MSRLADPTICPDCRAPLDREAVCTACGLRFQGPLAVRLWETMVAADGVVEQLRAARVSVPVQAPHRVAVAVAAPPAPPVPAGRVAAADLPSAPPVAARPPHRRTLPPMSVPVVLLALGALCLLVAAVVFVVVTWGSLGLLGRTLVLLGVTAGVAMAARSVTRRGLRGAAEALWLVVAGMLALDLWAAHSSGLAGLDALSDRHSVTLTGLALAALGAGVGLWTARRPVTALWGMQVVAVLGAVAATLSGAFLADDTARGVAVAVPLLAAGACVVRRLPFVAASIGGVAAASWLALTAIGVDRVVEPVGWTAWWSGLRGWPLLVAGVYAGAGTLVRRLPLLGRQALAGACLLLLGVLAIAPVEALGSDRQVVVRSAVVVALVLVAATVRDVTWWVPAGLLAAVGALWVALLALVAPWGSLAALPFEGPLDLPTPPVPGGADAWTFLVAALAAAVALVALPRRLSRHLPGDRAAAGVPVGTVAAATVLGAGVATAVLGQGVPLAVAGVVLTALTLAVAALTWRLRVGGQVSVLTSVAGGGGTAYLALMALTVAAPSWTLSAAVATTLATALAAWFADAERRGPLLAPAVLAAASVGLGGYAVHAWLRAADAPDRWSSWSVIAFAGAVALTAHLTSRRPTSRLVLELTSLVVGLAGAVVATTDADAAHGLTMVAGVAVVLAVAFRDRAQAGWVSLAVIVVATTIRTGLLLPHPELYVVPLALVLLAAGALRGRDRTDRAADVLVGLGLAHATVTLLASLRLDLTATVVATGGTVVLAVLAAHLDREDRVRTAPPAVLLAVLLAGVALTGWLRQAEVDLRVPSLALAVLAALVLLAAAAVTRLSWSRVAAEVGAAALGVASLTQSPDVSTTAHALVLLGTAAAFVAVGQRDRSELGWLALPLLGVAEALLGHEDSPVVEAWLLPALVVLVVGGARRLRGERVAAVSSPLLSGTALGVVAGIGALTDPDVDRLAVATAVLVLVGMVAAWLVTERLDTTLEAPVAALAVAASGVTCVWTWTHAAVAGPPTTSAAYAVLAAALLVAAGPLSRQPASRLVLEASGGLVALATLATAPTGPAQPMVLTIVGSAVAVVSVLHRDRVQAGWLSTVLLGAATYLRVVDDVQAPELYTLPAAALLLAAGAWRLRSDIQVGSLSALGSGLTLALVPSLLLALDEPVSLRGALVGGGAVLALAVGVRHRLVAPFAFGAGSVALLALRHLTPVSDAVPRWVSLAVLGVALLVVGITWEQRLRDLRAARAYIAALR